MDHLKFADVHVVPDGADDVVADACHLGGEFAAFRATAQNSAHPTLNTRPHAEGVENGRLILHLPAVFSFIFLSVYIDAAFEQGLDLALFCRDKTLVQQQLARLIADPPRQRVVQANLVGTQPKQLHEALQKMNGI
ncbi:MAG: hypothetical protein WAQ08_09150 [Aquabacterium sp.]|uniref:hypothetical protein n=1 Tax=Aquabacterium sp. TaxID=1872578 RepID=UPI003BAE9797